MVVWVQSPNLIPGCISGVYVSHIFICNRAKYDVVKMKKKTEVVPTMDEIVNILFNDFVVTINSNEPFTGKPF